MPFLFGDKSADAGKPYPNPEQSN